MARLSDGLSLHPARSSWCHRLRGPGDPGRLACVGAGWPDIYFVNGARQPKLEKDDPSFYNRLYRNYGDGTFAEVTLEAGVKGEGFATGVAAGDYDNDGLLDLFVVNYCVWIPGQEPPCNVNGIRTYCSPKYYAGLPNNLYHDNGDGTFTDVSESSGIAAHIGKGMGVSFLDFDQDGRLDVFVANDTVPNFLFRNEGGGRFREVALRAGPAFNEDGRALSSMGVDARDIDNDGREDLFIAALANETFPLFRNIGKGLFANITYGSGLGRQTRAATGWSNGVFDLN